jgi:hypothetical protein
MKPPQDPPRLLDPGSDAPAWLRASLEAGARDVPGPQRLAVIAAHLPVGPLGPGPGPGGSPPGAPHGAPPGVSPVASQVGGAAAPAVPSMLSGAAIGAALGLAVLGAGQLASSRVGSPPPPPPAALVSVAPGAPASPRFDPAPASAPARRAPGVAGRSAPRPGATALPEPSGAAAEPAAPVEVAAETESSILQQAQDALGGDPARALSLTDLHRARFPGGRLAQEREVLAIQALLGLGRGAEARARAASFLASFPTSADRRRLVVLIPDLQSSDASHKESGAPPSTP